MTYRKICTTQSWAAWGFGLALLIVPGKLLGLLGLTLTPGLLLVTQVAGGMMFALGATLHVVRNEISITNIQVICGSNGAVDLVLCIILVRATMAGVINSIGYVFAGIFALNVVSWIIAYIRRGPYNAQTTA